MGCFSFRVITDPLAVLDPFSEVKSDVDRVTRTLGPTNLCVDKIKIEKKRKKDQDQHLII